MSRINRMRVLLAALLLAGASAARAQEAAGPIEVTCGAEGVTSLKYAGVELLHDGRCRVTGAFFRKWDGTVYAADLAAGKPSGDAAARRVAWTYPWGQVELTFAPGRDRLDLNVALSTKQTSSS